MTKQKKNKISRLFKNLVKLIIILIIISIASLFIAPSEEEWKNRESLKTSYIENLEMPAPIEGEQIINHVGYTLSYNEEYEQASYVAYKLTQNELYGPAQRKDNFKADPAVKTGSATLDDYKKSGYDRGHLCPAADQKESDSAMSDSFYMSNMSPQSPQFNRGIWADLEGTVRTFADNNHEIYVVTGPILSDGPYETIGKNKVAIPNYYYKVILDYKEPEIKAIGFILPNKKGEKDLEEYATNINHIESITNIDFFVNLPNDVEEVIENSFNINDWEFKEFYASNGKGSFNEDQGATATTTNEEPQGFVEILKEEGLNILVQIRKTTIDLIDDFIPSNILISLGII